MQGHCLAWRRALCVAAALGLLASPALAQDITYASQISANPAGMGFGPMQITLVDAARQSAPIGGAERHQLFQERPVPPFAVASKVQSADSSEPLVQVARL